MPPLTYRKPPTVVKPFPALARPDLRRVPCASLRAQVDALARVPPVLIDDAYARLLPLARECVDRAEHGCPVCGSLIARPDGGCRAESDGAA